MIISKSNKKQKVNNSKNNVYKRMTKQTKILIHQQTFEHEINKKTKWQ